jgi:hypothetical protein
LFDDDRGQQNPRKGIPVMDFVGFEDLVQGVFADLDSGDKKKDGHDQGSDMLHPAMSVGSFGRCRACGHAETHHQDHRIRHMREEMKGIGDDRDGICPNSQPDLYDEQRQHGCDGKPSCHDAMFRPDLIVENVVEIFDESRGDGAIDFLLNLHSLLFALLFFQFQKLVTTDKPAFDMLAGILGSPASLTLFHDLELQTTFIAEIDFTLFHIRAVDHINLLISFLALDYIQ